MVSHRDMKVPEDDRREFSKLKHFFFFFSQYWEKINYSSKVFFCFPVCYLSTQGDSKAYDCTFFRNRHCLQFSALNFIH